MTRGAWYGIQIFGDHSEAKIGYARMVGVIHEDVRLASSQQS